GGARRRWEEGTEARRAPDGPLEPEGWEGGVVAGGRPPTEPPPAVSAVLTPADRRAGERAEIYANAASPKPRKALQTREKRRATAKARQHRRWLDKLGVTGSSPVPPIVPLEVRSPSPSMRTSIGSA